MNLIDAIKSGRSYRRLAHRGCASWQTPPGRSPGYNEFRCELSDLLADDYEIQEASVQITRSQFYKAVATVIKNSERLQFEIHPGVPAYNEVQELARKLGLEPEVDGK